MNDTMRLVLIVAIVVLGLLILVPMLVMAAMMGGMGMMGGGMMNDGMTGGTWMMLLFFLLVLAGVALLATWAVRRLGSSRSGPITEEALQILRARYARGEISREEFERIRDDLGDTPGTREELSR